MSVTKTLVFSMFSAPFVQVSYSSSSGVLDDREQFPYFFRTIPSDKDIVLGISEFIDYFNWSRVVIFTQDDERFKTVSVMLLSWIK